MANDSSKVIPFDLHALSGTLAAEDLLERVNDSVIVCDAQGTITFWNKASQQIYGWSRDKAIGADLHALLQTNISTKLRHAINNSLAHQTEWDGELEQRRRDGATVRVSSQWLPGGNGSQILISRDITAREQAQIALTDSQKRYQRYVDENLTGSFVMQADGTIVT